MFGSSAKGMSNLVLLLKYAESKIWMFYIKQISL